MATQSVTLDDKPSSEPTSELHNDDCQDLTALPKDDEEAQTSGRVTVDREPQNDSNSGDSIESHSSNVEPTFTDLTYSSNSEPQDDPNSGDTVESLSSNIEPTVTKVEPTLREVEPTLTEDQPTLTDSTNPSVSLHSLNQPESEEMPSNYIELDSDDNLRPVIISVLLQARENCLSLQGLRMAIEGNYTEYRRGSDTWVKVMENLLHQYDFPTMPVLNGSRVNFKLLPGIDRKSKAFDPSEFHTKPFALMKLPHRVRLMVYRHALSLPTSDGWIVDDQYTANASHYYNNKPPGDSLQLRTRAAGHFTLVSPPIQTWMALISVNSKLYREAMPIFYAHNTFRLSSCATLNRFLQQLPTRQAFVQRIVLHYDPPLYNSQCSAAFKQLAETSLRHLKLELDESAVLHRGNGFGSVARLPGFHALLRMRGLESLSFAGRFDRAKRLLARMLAPMPAAERRVEDVEARLEKEWVRSQKGVRQAHVRVMKDLRKEAKKEAAEKRRQQKEEEKREERAQREEERAQEREKREAEKESANARKRREREEERARKQAEKAEGAKERMEEEKRKKVARSRERELEKAQKDIVRANKKDAQRQKQRLMHEATRLKTGKRARDEETDTDGEEVSSKRARRTGDFSGSGGFEETSQIDERNIDPQLLRKSMDEGDDREDAQGHPIIESEESEEE